MQPTVSSLFYFVVLFLSQVRYSDWRITSRQSIWNMFFTLCNHKNMIQIRGCDSRGCILDSELSFTVQVSGHTGVSSMMVFELYKVFRTCHLHPSNPIADYVANL